MSAILGIDFGTAYFTGAVVKDGLPRLVTDEEDVSSIASYIFRGSGGKWLVGDEAKREAEKNNSEYLSCLKRYIVASDTLKVLVGNKAENLSSVTAKIFRKLKQNAEVLLASPISEAIIVLPERLQYKQQQIVVKAAREAGLSVKSIIPDGMAALATYAWEMGNTENVLVCDFGAGTVSVTLGSVANGSVETIYFNREFFFGGRDFDRKIVQRLVRECIASGADINGKKGAEEILYGAAETARQTLSAGENIAVIAVDLPGKRTSHKVRFERTFSSEELLEVMHGYRERILELLNGVKTDMPIDKIILTGGLSTMPMVSNCLEKVFGKTPQFVYRIREASAMGAVLMECEHLPPPEGYGFAALVDELPPREMPYKILVTPTMSSGKTTFNNQLIGENVSKTENLACTDRILTFVNDLNGENNSLSSDAYRIKFKGLLAKADIILKDSPGVNSSMNPQHRKITEAEIKRGDYDLLIYIINATQVATDDDSYHLEFVLENAKDKNILFLLNKVDRWNSENENIHTEIPQVKDYLKSHGFDSPLLLPISAQAAEAVRKFNKGKMLRSDKRELYNMIDKFEKINLSEYYQQTVSKVQVNDFANEENNLLKTCGIRYVEKIILEFYKGDM